MKATMETWRRFCRLNGYSRGVALEAAIALMATSIGLRLAGFRPWKALLVWFAPSRTAAIDSADPRAAAALDSARAIARLEQAAARRLFFRTNCLEQSLVLWWLLKRRGLDGEMRFGARKEAGRFEAHAWVEVGGVALNNAGEGHLHFVPFEGSITAMETQIHCAAALKNAYDAAQSERFGTGRGCCIRRGRTPCTI